MSDQTAVAIRYPPEIIKAIAAVRAAVPYLQKDAKNAHFQYAYVSEGQVLGRVREAMGEAGLVIIPNVTATEHHEKGLVSASMEFELVHSSGKAWPEKIKWVGMGQDTQDKGVAKAATSGLKYFLLKLFMIETGDDPDKDGKPVETDSGVVKHAGGSPPDTSKKAATVPPGAGVGAPTSTPKPAGRPSGKAVRLKDRMTAEATDPERMKRFWDENAKEIATLSEREQAWLDKHAILLNEQMGV